MLHQLLKMRSFALRQITVGLNREVCVKNHVLWMSTMDGNLVRAKVQIDSKIEEELESRAYRYRHRPGKVTVNTITVPKPWEKAALLSFKENNITEYKNEAQSLANYLACRQPPAEAEHIKQKALVLEKDCLENNRLNRKNFKTADDLEHAVKKWVNKRISALTFNWKPIEYTERKSLAYLVGRSPADYAALCQIFNEIKLRQPNFKPSSILDFGSGTGTALWSAYTNWGNDIKEYFAVDVSPEMNSLAREICQGGDPEGQHVIKSAFYRQFLPATHTLRYDMVVSAYSLMELPSVKSRLQTVENLWAKTENFLIFVETGTNAGYELIAEARDFILRTTKTDVHVFSPCSHELACPRLADKTPCNFSVNYYSMFHRQIANIDIKTEKFSYVILQKKERDMESFPRIVRAPLSRGGHVVCRLCCPDGQLKEVIVTASKHGKTLYKCARMSKWGDLLPAVPKEQEQDDNVNSGIDEQTLETNSEEETNETSTTK